MGGVIPAAEVTRRDMLLAKWKESGKSIPEFCRAENIPEQILTLYNWQRREQQKNELLTKGEFIPIPLRRVAPPKQIPLRPIEQPKEISCEINFPSGVQIIFHALPDAGFIKELM